MKLQVLLLITLCLLGARPLSSQVTIGSGIAPLEGALLDLKEFSSLPNESTSTKGLMLPRVVLTDLEKLYPMFSETDPDYQGANYEVENTRHAGLLVYHVKDDLEIKKGVYIWDGKRWARLSSLGNGGVPEQPGDNGDTVTDHEGNEYPIGDFNEAGWWTLQNVRAKTLLNGDFISFSNEVDATDPNLPSLIRIFYPNGTDNSEIQPFTYQEKYGMLYSLSAALNGEDVPTGSNLVRGLCPKGWHVPTDNDWLLLEKEIYKNFHLYSDGLQQSDIGSWEDYWESIYADGYRGKFGTAFKSTEKVNIHVSGGETIIPETKGFSKPASEKGFDVYLVGVALNGKKGVQQISDLRYGTGGQFWTSSTWHSGSGHATRKANSTENGFGRAALPTNYLLSLRCKKDPE